MELVQGHNLAGPISVDEAPLPTRSPTPSMPLTISDTLATGLRADLDWTRLPIDGIGSHIWLSSIAIAIRDAQDLCRPEEFQVQCS
jgi:hypothetical protein